ncbi:carbonic anhydrase [Salinisphaera sp. P385]|uniref:Carbonic anhydrase n=1 Tax=Spectribacter acetivorans TaxID=3075603 RepID=A0ABU3B8C8_9GAMM|nr:carbonic anhydrase [Salinisphaera sp. P385]MDT0618724.1 carbonic anhydrase [Salinisphaera sp. P385]
MDKILDGIERFQGERFADYRELFAELAGGQSPATLFITCADSRVDPSLITGADPGDLFVCRNAGNIVPPYGGGAEGTAASVEYAVGALNVRDVIVCGHSGCGAMTGALAPENLSGFPQVGQWLTHCHAAVTTVRHNHPELDGADQLDRVIEQNTLVQLQHLRTHPAVAARLAADGIRLHAWVYDIGSGQIRAHNPDRDAFEPLDRAYASLRENAG